MMPLLDENRSLVKRGLQFMKQYKYPALELLKGSRDYDVTTVGFTIAPRINAFGRLPELVNPVCLVKYFLKGTNPAYLEKVSNYASKVNSKRQSMTTSLYKEAVTDTTSPCLFYGSEDMHEGLVGLVAGKYAREYEQPAFVKYIRGVREELMVLTSMISLSIMKISLYNMVVMRWQVVSLSQSQTIL